MAKRLPIPELPDELSPEDAFELLAGPLFTVAYFRPTAADQWTEYALRALLGEPGPNTPLAFDSVKVAWTDPDEPFPAALVHRVPWDPIGYPEPLSPAVATLPRYLKYPKPSEEPGVSLATRRWFSPDVPLYERPAAISELRRERGVPYIPDDDRLQGGFVPADTWSLCTASLDAWIAAKRCRELAGSARARDAKGWRTEADVLDAYAEAAYAAVPITTRSWLKSLQVNLPAICDQATKSAAAPVIHYRIAKAK